jgi:ATP-dependent protease ClpP protease subunit
MNKNLNKTVIVSDEQHDNLDLVVKHLKTTVTRKTTIYLDKNISDAEVIRQLCLFFRTADENDEVELLIGGHGGSVELGLELLNSLDVSEAKITSKVVSPVYSMHALIAASQLKKGNTTLEQNVFFMFHDISTLTMGKLSELKEQLNATKEWGKSIFKRCADWLLTNAEIEDILSGRDKYIFSAEIKERADKHLKNSHEPKGKK